jgi:hypothetical protein
MLACGSAPNGDMALPTSAGRGGGIGGPAGAGEPSFISSGAYRCAAAFMAAMRVASGESHHGQAHAGEHASDGSETNVHAKLLLELKC